jgi:hypothetical protein
VLSVSGACMFSNKALQGLRSPPSAFPAAAFSVLGRAESRRFRVSP